MIRWIASGLVVGAIEALAAIGRWVLRRIARRGVRRILAYMEERVVVFWRRFKRATSDLRRRWLLGRIGRWARAVQWIKRVRLRLLRPVARELCVHVEIPDTANEETFDLWRECGTPHLSPVR